MIVCKVIESEVGLGTQLGIWSKHIHLACTELYFSVLEKTRLYSQGEGHCPITTNRLTQSETNHIIHSGGSGGGAWVARAPPLFLRPKRKNFFGDRNEMAVWEANPLWVKRDNVIQT